MSTYSQLHSDSQHGKDSEEKEDDFINISLSSEKSTRDERLDEEKEDFIDENSSSLDRLKLLSKLALPVIATFFLGLGGNFINLAFAGQYKNHPGGESVVFAGLSLATMFANVSSLSLMVGMSTAMETLGAQYNGARNYKQVGITLQKSCCILLSMVGPILLSWLFVDRIFALVGIDEYTCTVVSRFLRVR